MTTLREQLLQAGLVTAEQAEKAEEPQRAKSRRTKRGGKGRRADGVDLDDPKKLEVMKAIERHRVRDEIEGEIAFNFTIRGGAKIRKMFVDIPTAAKLGSGALAIVENGTDDEHVIVTREAVAAIRAVDPDAVRFHQSNN